MNDMGHIFCHIISFIHLFLGCFPIWEMSDINLLIKYFTCIKYNSFYFFGLILLIYQFLLFFQYLFQSKGKEQNPVLEVITFSKSRYCQRYTLSKQNDHRTTLSKIIPTMYSNSSTPNNIYMSLADVYDGNNLLSYQ